MAVRTRIDPIDREVKLTIDQALAPEAISREFAAAAKGLLDDADATNRQVLGRVPRSHTFVDGVEGRALASVRPNGVVVREYELVSDVLLFIADELKAISPYRFGRYKASHTLFADGVETKIGDTIPEAREYVFLSDVDYARKIEGSAGRKPESRQAPKGVYEVTSIKAAGRFGNIARIRFVWRSPILSYVSGGRNRVERAAQRSMPAKQSAKHMERATRVPAIIVTVTNG